MIPPRPRTAADATIRGFMDSWNRADGAAYGENYWDAKLVSPVGKVLGGKSYPRRTRTFASK